MANRPISRIFWRIFAALRYGRQKSHWQDALPGLKIISDDNSLASAIEYKGKPVCPLSGFNSIRWPNDITIIGSGPSIRQQDLSVLPEKSAILLNGAIHLIGNFIRQPACVMIEDERFVWHAFDLMQEKIGPKTLCFFSVSVIRAICENDPAFLSNKTIILIDNAQKPYGKARVATDALKSRAFIHSENQETALFSNAPELGIIPVGTVAYTALQFVIAKSPEKIGLAGIDLGNASQPRFYESRQNGSDKPAWSGIDESIGKILSGFKLAKFIAANRDIEIENYSPVSALQQVGYGYTPRLEKKTSPKTT